MRIVSDNIKNALKQPTTQRKGRILVDGNYYEVYNVEYYADAYEDGNVIGNAIASQLDFDLPYIDKFDTFKYFDGVWTENEYEYVDMGTFTVFDEQDEDEFNKHITAFDNLIKFNKVFEERGTYPKTLYQELQNICEQADVELVNIDIPNGDFILENNQFVNNETLKTVLKAICQISGNYGIIKEDKLALQLSNNTDEIINKNHHEPVTWKRKTYGINQVILQLGDVDGEYVIRQDEENIAENGIHKLVITNNPFAYSQDKRDALIDELFNQVRGFGYIPYEMNYEWLNYLEIGDKITIDGIETVVLRIQGKSPKSLESFMSAPALIDSAIEYAQNTDTIKNILNRTEIIVDKNAGTINNLTQQTISIEDRLNNDYYNINKTNELLQNSSQGLTNTFSEAGGNNIFRNTGLWFKDIEGFEFWQGNAGKTTNEKATNQTSILLQKGIFVQEQEVSNGNYSISFYYRKLIELANASVLINDVEYLLDSLEFKQFYTGEKDGESNEYITQPITVSTNHLKIEFRCDTNNAVEIYDLMANKGSVKLAYSQNQNETTTDTVNISKGITITSSDLDVQFKANADGIRTLDNYGNKITDFTDKGMTTKEATIENEANVVGVLRQRVGDQVWDSFIG